jgi:hypothetical protein
MTTTEKLARANRLCGFRTRYEVAAICDDGRRYLLAYTSQKSRRGLWNSLTERLEDGSLDRVIGTRAVDWCKPASKGARLGQWTVQFTGRTQRDCYCGTELEFLADVA